ncbi:MAG TPA: energy transducer TonB [Pyrinomonadaceae bacterium]|jgi:TonB family protein
MPRVLTLSLLLLTASAFAFAPAPALAQRPEARASADEKFERGKALFERGDARGALPLLRDAAEQRKTDADAWYLYGLALNRAGKHKDARKAFEKSLKARPDSAVARAGLAHTLLLLGKTGDAEREAGRALALGDNLAEPHYVMAVVHYRRERLWPAAVESEKALALRPDFAEAALLHGDLLVNIYIDVNIQQAEKYPRAAPAGGGEGKGVPEKRDSTTESLKARMRETAVRLEGMAASARDADEAERMRETAGSLRVYASAETPGIFRQTEVTTKALIIEKPEPGFTEEARNNNVTGRVRLRAVLGADGRVRNIAAIHRLPDGLTEKCIEVARKIKFKPATFNGAPVSQWVILEYNFNIY